MNKKSPRKYILLQIIFAFLLSACGDVGAYPGRYYCTDSPALSTGISADDEWLELNFSGKGTLHLMGKDYAITWSASGEELTLTQNDREFNGLISDGVISVSLDGLLYTYAKAGTELPSSEEEGMPQSKQNAIQKWWNGDWYGWWNIHDATGDWSELNGSFYDCYAKIELDATGVGTITLWDESSSLCKAELKLDAENSDSRIGAVTSTNGFFWSWKIGEGDWSVDPAQAEYDNVFSLENGYYEDENGSFRYDIFLRPWGQIWDDIAQSDTNILPSGYFPWYLPLIDTGGNMPDVPNA